jgi:hypothetical protein
VSVWRPTFSWRRSNMTMYVDVFVSETVKVRARENTVKLLSEEGNLTLYFSGPKAANELQLALAQLQPKPEETTTAWTTTWTSNTAGLVKDKGNAIQVD